MEFINFEHVRPIITWRWKLLNKECPICRNDLMECSIQCQASKSDIELSQPCINKNCGHAFHKDCIDMWLKNQPVCPLCNTSWETKIFKK